MSKTHAELLHCPFCNGQSLLCTEEVKCYGKYYGVICKNCKNQTSYYESSEEAIKIWNTRVNKEAEFLEWLEEECETELKNKLFLSDGQIITYKYFLEKIQQFQAEQKQVSDV